MKLEKGNSVFGIFQEPRLYATQAFSEENDPKKLNPMTGELKDKITLDRLKVNTKGKDLIERKNCIQYWGITNDICSIGFTTTVRWFVAIKVANDLIKGLIGPIDKMFKEKHGFKFWDFAYDVILKDTFC